MEEETKMNKYQYYKGQATEKAIDYQREYMSKNMSYGECAYLCDYFAKIGKRYGLLKEFRENGLI